MCGKNKNKNKKTKGNRSHHGDNNPLVYSWDKVVVVSEIDKATFFIPAHCSLVKWGVQ